MTNSTLDAAVPNSNYFDDWDGIATGSWPSRQATTNHFSIDNVKAEHWTPPQYAAKLLDTNLSVIAGDPVGEGWYINDVDLRQP
jgi:hypothetical protein